MDMACDYRLKGHKITRSQDHRFHSRQWAQATTPSAQCAACADPSKLYTSNLSKFVGSAGSLTGFFRHMRHFACRPWHWHWQPFYPWCCRCFHHDIVVTNIIEVYGSNLYDKNMISQLLVCIQNYIKLFGTLNRTD